MAGITAIRRALASALATLPGLRTHATIPDNLTPPAAVVGGPSSIEYDVTAARGADRYTLPVRLLVSKASDRSGQEKLDGYFANLIKNAIESDSSLAGAAMSVRVTSASEPGVYTIAGVDYLGTEFSVDVVAVGD